MKFLSIGWLKRWKGNVEKCKLGEWERWKGSQEGRAKTKENKERENKSLVTFLSVWWFFSSAMAFCCWSEICSILMSFSLLGLEKKSCFFFGGRRRFFKCVVREESQDAGLLYIEPLNLGCPGWFYQNTLLSFGSIRER